MKRTLFAISAALVTAFSSQAAPAIEESQSMHSYILLDRTGSMSSIWDEALSSENSYAETVNTVRDGEDADTLSTEITLSVFDSQDGLQFDTLRRNATGETWNPVTNDEASPRGMTPLFDAIGRMVSMAEADSPERAVIVIMTDGHENASREMTMDGARAALDRARERGWEVVFLGADFGQFNDAESVGMDASKTMGMSSGTMVDSMNRLAGKARDYGIDDEAEIEFNEEDRAVAREEDVKQQR